MKYLLGENLKNRTVNLVYSSYDILGFEGVLIVNALVTAVH